MGRSERTLAISFHILPSYPVHHRSFCDVGKLLPVLVVTASPVTWRSCKLCALALSASGLFKSQGLSRVQHCGGLILAGPQSMNAIQTCSFVGGESLPLALCREWTL